MNMIRNRKDLQSIHSSNIISPELNFNREKGYYSMEKESENGKVRKKSRKRKKGKRKFS